MSEHDDHTPTPHTIRHCTICARKQGMRDADRRLAICVLIADKWTYDEEGQEELVAQADAVLRVVERVVMR